MSEEFAEPHEDKPPSPWVARFLAGVAGGGQVLDVACGSGRHMRLALERGYRVTGIDRDVSPVDDLAARNDVGLVEADLEAAHDFPLRGMHYDGVIVASYLWRPILADIAACVAGDGVLIYETFARGQERHGRPSNPDFLLGPNELLEAALPRLVVVAYEHGIVEGAHPRIVQRIAACGPGHPWAGESPVPLPGSGG